MQEKCYGQYSLFTIKTKQEKKNWRITLTSPLRSIRFFNLSMSACNEKYFVRKKKTNKKLTAIGFTEFSSSISSLCYRITLCTVIIWGGILIGADTAKKERKKEERKKERKKHNLLQSDSLSFPVPSVVCVNRSHCVQLSFDVAFLNVPSGHIEHPPLPSDP